jgi:release factor glutamine methyltransferase
MPYHDARLQAELLLARTLGTTRAMVLARLGEILAPDVAAQYAANVARRAQHEPLAYILGHQEFYGLDFLVDRRVLIPRHETEMLVELALRHAPRVPHASPVVVDVGTGSGALALVFAHHLPHAHIFATEISSDALVIARANAARLNLDGRVMFLQGDLLALLAQPFDILVANLPYIPSARFDRLPREIRDYEPRVALDGGEDGLAVMRRLLARLEAHATRGAVAFLEIPEEQGAAAVELCQRQFPRAPVLLHCDLEGLDRVVEVRWTDDDRPPTAGKLRRSTVGSRRS